MHKYEIDDELQKKLKKLSKKNKILFEQVLVKINEICNSSNIDHYKNLRNNLKEYKRVHIGHFVLIFRCVEDIITFEDLDHHDGVYDVN